MDNYDPLYEIPKESFGLSIEEILDIVNSKKHYFYGKPTISENIDWEKTDAWRRSEIRSLPLAPSGKNYAFNPEKHRVELVDLAQGERAVKRRKIDGKAPSLRQIIYSDSVEGVYRRTHPEERI